MSQNPHENIRIGDVEVGPNAEPYIIAEMSGNHNQSLERALQIVDAAAAIEGGLQAAETKQAEADAKLAELEACVGGDKEGEDTGG